MGVKQPSVTLTEEDLNETDRNVLIVLDGGRATAAFVAGELGISRQYASDRLRRFEEHGVTEKIAPALYDLRDDPREAENDE